MFTKTSIQDTFLGNPQLHYYKCHKEVWADSIKEIHEDYMLLSMGVRIDMVNSNGYTPFGTSLRVSDCQPVVGDYFMVYGSGYEMWLSKAEFEHDFALKV